MLGLRPLKDGEIDLSNDLLASRMFDRDIQIAQRRVKSI